MRDISATAEQVAWDVTASAKARGRAMAGTAVAGVRRADAVAGVREARAAAGRLWYMPSQLDFKWGNQPKRGRRSRVQSSSLKLRHIRRAGLRVCTPPLDRASASDVIQYRIGKSVSHMP